MHSSMRRKYAKSPKADSTFATAPKKCSRRTEEMRVQVEKLQNLKKMRESQRSSALYYFRRDMWLKKWLKRIHTVKLIVIYGVFLVWIRPFVVKNLISVMNVKHMDESYGLRDEILRQGYVNITDSALAYKQDVYTSLYAHLNQMRKQKIELESQVVSIMKEAELEGDEIKKQMGEAYSNVIANMHVELASMERTCEKFELQNILQQSTASESAWRYATEVGTMEFQKTINFTAPFHAFG